MNAAMLDWTQGREAILYQHCRQCAHVQYFARPFCASCGSQDVRMLQASGAGVVYAASLVHRAPTPETRTHAPYNIVLVDMAEGFRMMAHGANDLAIGDTVVAGYKPFAGTLVPFFRRKGYVMADAAVFKKA